MEGVPAALRPDGAWKRPAHTDPSLTGAPVGLQPPYCARPPRSARRQERGAGRETPIRLVPPTGPPFRFRREDGVDEPFHPRGFIYQKTPISQQPFQPETYGFTTSNGGKPDFKGEEKQRELTINGTVHGDRRRLHFSSDVRSVMRVQVLIGTQTRARQHLSAGPRCHSSQATQTKKNRQFWTPQNNSNERDNPPSSVPAPTGPTGRRAVLSET